MAKAKSSGKSSHGGSRKGSGRKPSPAKALRKKVAEIVWSDPASVNAEIWGHAPALIKKLLQLADGGYERVERRLEPAGLVTVKRPLMGHVTQIGEDAFGEPKLVCLLDDEGRPILEPRCDEHGKPVYVEELLYPDLPPDQLVEVSRSVSVADGDRQAGQYLVDRILGKPRQAVELSGKNGGPIPVEIYLPDNGRDREPDPAQAQLPAPGDVPLDAG